VYWARIHRHVINTSELEFHWLCASYVLHLLSVRQVNCTSQRTQPVPSQWNSSSLVHDSAIVCDFLAARHVLLYVCSGLCGPEFADHSRHVLNTKELEFHWLDANRGYTDDVMLLPVAILSGKKRRSTCRPGQIRLLNPQYLLFKTLKDSNREQQKTVVGALN